jgi:hypothetical protein
MSEVAERLEKFTDEEFVERLRKCVPHPAIADIIEAMISKKETREAFQNSESKI